MTTTACRRGLRIGWLALAMAGGLGGCATVANPNPADPLEGWNRSVQNFNDGLDEAVLKPVAEGYRDITPQFVRTGVTNFFGNLADVWSVANQALQGKIEATLNMTMRVVVNSTFGMAGVLDVASEAGLERQSEDLGQTFGRWGIGPGPYLVLPVFGPSTVRDTVALPVDLAATSIANLGVEGSELTAASLLQLVNTRANLLGASNLLDQIALDRYTFLRDGYLARRRNQVYDGDPPELPQERFDDPSANKPP